MTKKKLSGQTAAIIILTILLLCAVAFGGVFAYYSTSSKQMSGRIVMATLSIGMDNKSEILLSGSYVVPGQSLSNDALNITNDSDTAIYVAVAYEVTATKDYGEGGVVLYPSDRSILDIGQRAENNPWEDYVYYYTDVETGEEKYVRCFVSLQPYSSTEKIIEVISANALKLDGLVGNELQQCEVRLKFQAFAIASNSFTFSQDTTKQEKCEQIVNGINSGMDVNMQQLGKAVIR